MNLNLTEDLFAENKPDNKSDSALWTFDMVRTIAALYNSGGGILRVGVNDDGTIAGVTKPEDYAADKGELAATLTKYLDFVPPFESTEINGYIQIAVSDGVLFPSILRSELERPPDPRNPTDSGKKYACGTAFIRRMNNKQPSSEPLQTQIDWRVALHLWESNRGVTIQGPMLLQFCLVINEWNPFAGGNTDVTIWKSHCLADAAGALGRPKIHHSQNETSTNATKFESEQKPSRRGLQESIAR